MPARPRRIIAAQHRCRDGYRGGAERDSRQWAPANWLAVGERYLTQSEAAGRAGVSKDTIVRARRAGRLPGARLSDGRWLIPFESLVAAGLEPSDDHPTHPTKREQVVGDPGDSGAVDRARDAARIAALEDVVARQDDELRFLRRLLADAVAARREL